MMTNSISVRANRRSLVGAGAGGLIAASVLPASALDHAVNPFTQGVASGDPSSDGFVIWTRLVRGWTENDAAVPPFTRFATLFERATGQYPLALTQKWISAGAALDPNTVFDFVTDNDIVSGNPGSPIIDAQGNLAGAAFDGNIDSLGGAFGFDPRFNRAVGVSTAAITEALHKVYGADALVAELTGHG